MLLEELYETYPNHNSQWNQNGFIPVSAKGVRNNNDPRLAFYESDGVLYKKKKTDDGFLYTRPSKEDNVREYNSYIAFDVFIRNRTGSPIADNLYFNKDTSNNDIFYNECVLVMVLFVKLFERVVSIIKQYAKWFQIIKRYTRWFQNSNYT